MIVKNSMPGEQAGTQEVAEAQTHSGLGEDESVPKEKPSGRSDGKPLILICVFMLRCCTLTIV